MVASFWWRDLFNDAFAAIVAAVVVVNQCFDGVGGIFPPAGHASVFGPQPASARS